MTSSFGGAGEVLGDAKLEVSINSPVRTPGVFNQKESLAIREILVIVSIADNGDSMVDCVNVAITTSALLLSDDSPLVGHETSCI